MSNSTDTRPIYRVNDTSVYGVYLWTMIALVVVIASILIYEGIRRLKVMRRILYGRIIRDGKEKYPDGLFEWIRESWTRGEDEYLVKVGLDPVMYSLIF